LAFNVELGIFGEIEFFRARVFGYFKPMPGGFKKRGGWGGGVFRGFVWMGFK